jgi:CHAT domain-containing protein
LVVLSACDTGLGEIQRREGVFGLRRAFAVVGARTLVMSLWKVPDAQTRDLTRAFYEELKLVGMWQRRCISPKIESGKSIPILTSGRR